MRGLRRQAPPRPHRGDEHRPSLAVLAKQSVFTVQPAKFFTLRRRRLGDPGRGRWRRSRRAASGSSSMQANLTVAGPRDRPGAPFRCLPSPAPPPGRRWSPAGTGNGRRRDALDRHSAAKDVGRRPEQVTLTVPSCPPHRAVLMLRPGRTEKAGEAPDASVASNTGSTSSRWPVAAGPDLCYDAGAKQGGRAAGQPPEEAGKQWLHRFSLLARRLLMCYAAPPSRAVSVAAGRTCSGQGVRGQRVHQGESRVELRCAPCCQLFRVPVTGSRIGQSASDGHGLAERRADASFD